MLLEQEVQLSRGPEGFVVAIECGKESILLELGEEHQVSIGGTLVLHTIEIEEDVS